MTTTVRIDLFVGDDRYTVELAKGDPSAMLDEAMQRIRRSSSIHDHRPQPPLAAPLRNAIVRLTEESIMMVPPGSDDEPHYLIGKTRLETALGVSLG